MKFVIAVVMLALALGAQSSVLPLAPVSYTAVSGAHLGHGGYYGGHYGGLGGYYGGHGAYYGGHGLYGGLGYHGGYAGHYAAPAAVAVHAPAAVAVHAAPAYHGAHAVVAAPAHGGTYVAKTRGAEHVAPLPGHVHSAASINLQPAPGTW